MFLAQIMLILNHKYYLQVGVGFGEELEVLRLITQRLNVPPALKILGVDINEGK